LITTIKWSNRGFHSSALTLGAFPANQAKRRARRRFWQTLARKHGVKHTMDNKMILRHLQAKGLMKVNKYQLEEWLHYQQMNKDYLAMKREEKARSLATAAPSNGLPAPVPAVEPPTPLSAPESLEKKVEL